MQTDNDKELNLDMDTQTAGMVDADSIKELLESFEAFIKQPENRIANDWETIWAQRDTWDWSRCAGFSDYGPAPSCPQMHSTPVDAGQRRQLHRLGFSNAWIDAHLRNWADAADVIMFANFQTALDGEPLADDEATEEELQQRERDKHERQIREEEVVARAAREKVLALRERLRQQPVSTKVRDLVHMHGKTDAWIDQNLHNQLEAVDFLAEEYHASRIATGAESQDVVWLFAEVPASAVAPELVEQATVHANALAQQLGLPPLQIRWIDELGPETQVGTRDLKARRDHWGCDLATLKDKHLVRKLMPAQRDPTTGRLRLACGNVLGITTPQEPTAIYLLADPQRYDDWKHPRDINLPPRAFFSDAILNVAFEDIETMLRAASGATVRNVVAYTTRQLWQLRHFKPELLAYGNPLKGLDVAVYETLTTSRSPFARIRGQRWFEEFVARYAPFKVGDEAASNGDGAV